jgi:hypothetical protein
MGIRDRLSGRGPARLAGDKIQRGVTVLAVVLLVAMVVVSVLLALATHDGGAGVIAFLLFVAAAAIGAALGFLFGLPRSRVADLTGATGTADPGEEPVTRVSTYYLTNSNLIKVSDWLTTIVIGLGLVNLGRVVPGLRSLGAALRDPLGGTPYAGPAGLCVLIIGVLAGFLLTYLWTSIRVRELLEEAERQSQQTVPELRNQTLGEARERAGRSNVKLLVPDDAPDDAVVTRQGVPPGTSVPRGTEVAVSMMERAKG